MGMLRGRHAYHPLWDPRFPAPNDGRPPDVARAESVEYAVTLSISEGETRYVHNRIHHIRPAR